MRDANHAEIVRTLKECGCSVLDLAGVGSKCPDLLVGFRGANTLMEIKTDSRNKYLRQHEEKQREWREAWRGNACLVTTPHEALKAVGVI